MLRPSDPIWVGGSHRVAEHQLATLLSEMADGGGFRLLGYASIEQYAAASLELSARVTRDLLRVGRRLPDLPRLAASLATGSLDWTKAREIVRIATPDTEAAWVERAARVNSRTLERDIAAASLGSPPPTGELPAEAPPARRRVVFEMESADAETLFQALAVLRARSDLDRHEVEDGALLAAMARTIIQGAESADPGPSGERYRVVVQSCPACGSASAPEGETSDTVAAESACDAEIVDMQPGPRQGHATRAIAPALRRRVLHRVGWRCEVPNCSNKLWLDVHHTDPWAHSRKHEFDKLLVVCSAHHRAIHEGGLSVHVDDRGIVEVEHADGRRFRSERRGRDPRGSGAEPGR